MKYAIKRFFWITVLIFVFSMWIDSTSTFLVFSVDKEYGLKHEVNTQVVSDVKNYGIGAIFFVENSVLLSHYYLSLVVGGLFFASHVRKTIKIYSENEIIAISMGISFLSFAFLKAGAAFFNFIVLAKLLSFI